MVQKNGKHNFCFTIVSDRKYLNKREYLYLNSFVSSCNCQGMHVAVEKKTVISNVYNDNNDIYFISGKKKIQIIHPVLYLP